MKRDSHSNQGKQIADGVSRRGFIAGTAGCGLIAGVGGVPLLRSLMPVTTSNTPESQGKWVINAQPLSVEEWQKQHCLEVIESPK